MFFAYIDPGSGITIFAGGAWLIAFLAGFLGIFSLFFKKIFRFLKKHKNKIVIIVVLILGFGSAILGIIIMGRKSSEFNKKLIILGFDGLSPEIIEPMMEEGKLPNFSRLKEKGSYRHLTTTNPSQSPVAWAGFATGMNPGKHGIFDFIIRSPKTYGLDLSLSNIRDGKPRKVIKSKCFWEYTSEKKIPTVILACPLTFPPYKIYGRMLSGMGVPDILGTEGTFTFYTTETLDKDKDVGGKVFEIEKSPVMTMDLIGPRVSFFGGKGENSKVPFKVILKDQNTIIIEYQKHRFELKAGEWSDWKEVAFKAGLFRKARGIFKFYLIEVEPEFKLYASPINFDPRYPFFAISYPESYAGELADKIGLYHTQGMPMDTWALNEKRLTEKVFMEQVREVLREKKAMLDYEMEHFEKGVIFCYFESPDIIQHMFWRYTDPRHPLYEENAPLEYKEMIQNWYRNMDDILGAVMEKAGEEDTLIALSDHGFNTFRRTVHVNTWLRKNGYLGLKDSDARSEGGLLGDIEWTETRAYAIGFGAIYINQEGRERDGIVKPGSESERLKEELRRRLSEWSDEKYGTKIINRVYTREEIFWGDYAAETPDLYIGFDIGYGASWQTALGSVPETLVEDNLKKWSGSHLFDPALIPGVIFCNRQIIKEPSIYDITPTILKITGHDKETIEDLDLDGDSLFR